MRPYPVFAILFLILALTFANGCATLQQETEAQTPDAIPAVVKAPSLEKISFMEEETYTRIQMEGSAPMAAPFYKLLPDPARIVIDIPNLDLKQIKEPLKINNGTVGEVLVTQYDDKARIEIGLLAETGYNISKEDRILRVDIEKIKKVAEAGKEEEKKQGSAGLKNRKNPLKRWSRRCNP